MTAGRDTPSNAPNVSHVLRPIDKLSYLTCARTKQLVQQETEPVEPVDDSVPSRRHDASVASVACSVCVLAYGRR